MTPEPLENKNELEELQKKKLEFEIKKVEIEVNQLNRKWYLIPQNVVPILAPIFTGMITLLGAAIVGFYFSKQGVLLEAKKENLIYDNKKLNDKLVQYKIDSAAIMGHIDSMFFKYNKLISLNQELAIKNRNIGNENNVLSDTKRELEFKNSKLSQRNRALDYEVEKAKVELTESKLVEKLNSIDSIGVDFNPKHRLYGGLKYTLKNMDRATSYRVISTYGTNHTTLLNNRLTVLLAAYVVYKDDKFLKYFEDLVSENAQSLYCDNNLQYSITIISDPGFSDENYHEILSKLLQKAGSLKCTATSFEILGNLLGKIRSDVYLNPSKDNVAFLNYVELFRGYICGYDIKNRRSLLKYLRTLKMPNKIVATYWSEYIIKGNIQLKFDSYYDHSLMQTPAWADGQNRKNVMDVNFWKDWQAKNRNIVNRLKEHDLDSYRKDKGMAELELK